MNHLTRNNGGKHVVVDRRGKAAAADGRRKKTAGLRFSDGQAG